jgi:hypothetical protein
MSWRVLGDEIVTGDNGDAVSSISDDKNDNSSQKKVTAEF